MEISPPLSVHPHGQHCGVSLGERCCAPWGELGRRAGQDLRHSSQKEGGGTQTPGNREKRGEGTNNAALRKPGKEAGGSRGRRVRSFFQ